MMKRKGFILAEILTGLMIQAWFIVTLCGAFYLLLTFSNRVQQSNAAQDHGQRVIAYVDARIRNAGLGLWGCKDAADKVTPESIFTTLTTIGSSTANYMLRLQNLHLPVAITSRDVDNFGPYARPADGIYSGDVLTLLYAHRSYSTVNNNNSKLVLKLGADELSRDISSKTTTTIGLIAGNSGWNTIFSESDFANTGDVTNIRNYAVLEGSGVPIRIRAYNSELNIALPSTPSPTRIYNLSELLPLECERMYVTESKGQRSFMIKPLGVDNSGANAWGNASPHTAGILEIYMELNVSPDITPKMPIFTLKVLVNEGKSDTPTQKPSNWPRRYWKTDYAKYKVHVSQASWKLPNLAPITY